MELSRFRYSYGAAVINIQKFFRENIFVFRALGLPWSADEPEDRYWLKLGRKHYLLQNNPGAKNGVYSRLRFLQRGAETEANRRPKRYALILLQRAEEYFY